MPLVRLRGRSLTLPMRCGSMPRSTAVARLRRAREHDLAADVRRRAAHAAARRSTALEQRLPSRRCWPCSRSITMCALLPRILRLRSLRKPPITESVVVSAHDDTLTARIDSKLIAARKPLFFERRWRAATSELKADALDRVEHARQQAHQQAQHEHGRDQRGAAPAAPSACGVAAGGCAGQRDHGRSDGARAAARRPPARTRARAAARGTRNHAASCDRSSASAPSRDAERAARPTAAARARRGTLSAEPGDEHAACVSGCASTRDRAGAAERRAATPPTPTHSSRARPCAAARPRALSAARATPSPSIEQQRPQRAEPARMRTRGRARAHEQRS